MLKTQSVGFWGIKKVWKLISPKNYFLQPIFDLESVVLGRKLCFFFWKSSKNRVLRLQTPKISLKNNFLTPIFFLEKYRTSAPKSYIYIGHTSSSLLKRFFWNPNVWYNRIQRAPKKNTTYIYKFTKKIYIIYQNWLIFGIMFAAASAKN